MTRNTNPVLKRFLDTYEWWDVQANIRLLEEVNPMSMETLWGAANRLEEKDSLAIAQDYADAWREFIQRRPEFQGPGCAPNKLLAFSKLPSFAAPSADALEEIASRVPCPLIKSVAARNRESDIAEATQLVEELLGTDSNGNLREGFAYFRQIDGARIRVTAAELTAVSLDGLRTIAREVREQRRLENLSSEEFRTERSALQKENREQRITQLINEKTGVEFTRKELIVLIKNGHKHILHSLLYYPNGSPRLGAQECMDRILGVRREVTREYAENYGRKF